MGREVYTVIKDTKSGKILWASTELCLDYPYQHGDVYFCGRHELTDYIASVCGADGEFDFSDPEVCEQMTAVLQEKQNAMDKEYDRMADRINLARTAASHAPSVDAFCDFCALLDDLHETMDETYWTEAEDMKALMLSTVYQARELLEEPDYSLQFNPSEHNLQLLWINDE